MGGRGDTDALIRLRVACELAKHAADDLGDRLPEPLQRQITDLCHAIQAELEARDSRFAADISKRS